MGAKYDLPLTARDLRAIFFMQECTGVRADLWNCIPGNAPSAHRARKLTFGRILPTDHSDGLGNFRFVNLQERALNMRRFVFFQFFFVNSAEFC